MELRQRELPLSQLARAYGVSRKTAYKWLGRYSDAGVEGLRDRPRVARRRPHTTPALLQRLLCEVREAHPTWGPRKVRARVAVLHPRLARRLPAPSTVGDILKRAGLVQARVRRRHVRLESPVWARTLCTPDAPNALWCVDFKGDFCTGDGTRLWTLTVTDGFSRKVLCARALTSPAEVGVRRVFTRLFARYGLPEAIRSDNGTPFAHAQSLGGLTRLSLWWLRLGVRLERTAPASPQQNGSHERMHSTMHQETLLPRPRATPRAQQRVFDAWVHVFNTLRPHEALGLRPPDALYRRSPRRPPRGPLPPWRYPGGYLARRVNNRGSLKLHGEEVFVGEAFHGEVLGLQPCGPLRYRLFLGALLLGEVHHGQVLHPRALLDSRRKRSPRVQRAA